MLFLFGVLCVMAQGALAKVISPQYVPDLGLLMAFGAGLTLGAVDGLLLAAALGYVADTLGGSLLGQWALVYIIMCQATRILTQHLNFQGIFYHAFFVFGLTFVCEFALAGAVWLLQEAPPATGVLTPALAIHAVTNAVMAPLFGQLILQLAARLESDRRRDLQLNGQRAGK